MAQTNTKRTKKEGTLCRSCEAQGYQNVHKETDKCWIWCSHCGTNGHHMSLCYKLKSCNLCGKAGHNPYRCWSYSTITKWILRARELNACVDCLRPFKPLKAGSYCYPYCGHCSGNSANVYFPPGGPQGAGGFRAESDCFLVRECQAELKEGKAITENQKMQIEELNSKITSLEDNLESSNATIDSLEWKLKSITKEKEQELQNVIKLDSLCKEKEMELRKLQLIISQKDIELEQHRKASAQPSQTVPATTQQPCSNPIPTVNQLKHMRETNYMKAMLTDLQNQHQKFFVIVNLLYNKIKTQEMHWLNHSSFNSYMGPYDTGQYFNRLQQV